MHTRKKIVKNTRTRQGGGSSHLLIVLSAGLLICVLSTVYIIFRMKGARPNDARENRVMQRIQKMTKVKSKKLVAADPPVFDAAEDYTTVCGEEYASSVLHVTGNLHTIHDDNYCDCMNTGCDEHRTSACSDLLVAQAVFECGLGFKNTGSLRPSLAIDRNLQLMSSKSIYASRVNDGVCDCLDGSDETETDVYCENMLNTNKNKPKKSQQRYQYNLRGGKSLQTFAAQAGL